VLDSAISLSSAAASVIDCRSMLHVDALEEALQCSGPQRGQDILPSAVHGGRTTPTRSSVERRRAAGAAITRQRAHAYREMAAFAGFPHRSSSTGVGQLTISISSSARRQAQNAADAVTLGIRPAQ